MKYSVKNFRVFDNNGVTVDLAPITILTGCNSSGKSSIAKSLLLLDSYFTNGRIDFTKRPYSLLGDFDKVLNRKSEDGIITIEYSTYSVAYDGEITVRLKFGRDEEDDLHNAFLKEICLLDSDGYTLYQSLCGKDGYYMDRACMKGLKERFFNFISRSYSRDYPEPLTKNPYAFSWLNEPSKLFSAINGIPERTVIRKARELQSLYVLNIFDWLNDCTCENIENTIYSHINSDLINNNKGVSTGIKMLVEDFRMSQCDTFFEYFNKKESKRQFYNEKNKNEETYLPHNKVLKSIHFDIIIHDFPTPFRIPDGVRNKLIAKGLSKSEIKLRWWNARCCSFEQVYSLLMTLERLACTESSIPYTCFTPNEFRAESSYILGVFDLYLNQILEEGITPNFKGVSYVTSSRANVQRMYTLEESTDFALLLRSYFETKRNFKSQEKPYYSDTSDIAEDSNNANMESLKDICQSWNITYTSPVHTPPLVGAEEYNRPNAFINKWLNQFGVAHHISIKKAEEGGVCIYLYKDEDDKEGELLADKGYGITQLVSILLQIEIAIMESNSLWIRPDLNGDNPKVGRHSQLIVIEEPEIHLHPNYQSLLADMFLEAYQKYNIHFVIETHSEYLIRKTQVFVSQKQYPTLEVLEKENPFKVYYISTQDGAYEVLYNINGSFSNEFGIGFFDEAENLVFKIV